MVSLNLAHIWPTRCLMSFSCKMKMWLILLALIWAWPKSCQTYGPCKLCIPRLVRNAPDIRLICGWVEVTRLKLSQHHHSRPNVSNKWTAKLGQFGPKIHCYLGSWVVWTLRSDRITAEIIPTCFLIRWSWEELTSQVKPNFYLHSKWNWGGRKLPYIWNTACVGSAQG